MIKTFIKLVMLLGLTASAQNFKVEQLTVIQQDNAMVYPIGADPTGATDSRAALQAEINLGIAQNKEVYIPGGTYTVSCPAPNSSTPALNAAASNVRIRGAGIQSSVSTPLTTTITATGNCPVLHVGTGTITSVTPGCHVRDIGLVGNGKPAVGSPNGYYGLSLDGIPACEVDNIYVGFIDIGIEQEGNSFGTLYSNIWMPFGQTNAAFYMPAGQFSGSDISFYNTWANGAFCAYCIAGNGGGYHISFGQVGAGGGTTGYNDNCGAIVLNYDYVSGSIAGTTGQVGVWGSSFEGTTGCWIFRNYGQSYLSTYGIAMNPEGPESDPPGAAAIGVYKGTAMGNAQISFRDSEISGWWNNPQLIVEQGSFAGGTNLLSAESNTKISAQSPTINGVSVFGAMKDAAGNSWTTMLGQSGLQGLSDINDESGPLTGGYRPMTTQTVMPLGSIPFGVGGVPNVAALLPGNNSPGDQVYVSHGVTVGTATNHCQAIGSGSVDGPPECVWDVQPLAGQTAVCIASSLSPSNAAFVVLDGDLNSPANFYQALAPITTFTNTTGQMQIWYHTYTVNQSPAPTVVHLFSNGASTNPAVQCQAFSGTTLSNPLDGSLSVANAASGNLTGTALTTTQANDYAICGGLNSTGSSALGVGSGFTLGQTIAGDYLSQYQLVASAGTLTPTMTWSGTGGAGMVCAAMKTASVVAPSLESAPAISTSNMTIVGPATAPSGSCTTNGQWVFSQDGHATACISGTWSTKI